MLQLWVCFFVLASFRMHSGVSASPMTTSSPSRRPIRLSPRLLVTATFSIPGWAAEVYASDDRPDDLAQWTRDRMLAAYAYSPTTYVQMQQARTVLRRQPNATTLLAEVTAVDLDRRVVELFDGPLRRDYPELDIRRAKV